MNTRRSRGQWGEQLAARFLQKKGYCIVEKNAYSRHGEIDLVAQHGRQWVFVEVKTRFSDFYGTPEQAITATKKMRWKKAAWDYLLRNHTTRVSFRFDVITIRVNKNSRSVRLRHYQNIAINE